MKGRKCLLHNEVTHQIHVLTSIAKCSIIPDQVHMRTTVNLDEDILRVADQLAKSRAISRGEAISELARRGVQQAQKPLPIKVRNGFAVLNLQAAEKFSSDDVISALSNEDTGQARLHS